jgi:hypothetical protein
VNRNFKSVNKSLWFIYQRHLALACERIIALPCMINCLSSFHLARDWKKPTISFIQFSFIQKMHTITHITAVDDVVRWIICEYKFHNLALWMASAENKNNSYNCRRVNISQLCGFNNIFISLSKEHYFYLFKTVLNCGVSNIHMSNLRLCGFRMKINNFILTLISHEMQSVKQKRE